MPLRPQPDAEVIEQPFQQAGERGPARRRDSLITATANGRPGTPEDIAGTVLFLASPAARHITGQVIAVNGGARTTR